MKTFKRIAPAPPECVTKMLRISRADWERCKDWLFYDSFTKALARKEGWVGPDIADSSRKTLNGDGPLLRHSGIYYAEDEILLTVEWQRYASVCNL